MSTNGVPAKQDQKKQNGKTDKSPKDQKKDVRDAKNKLKFHSTKMDLNLKVLREEMSSLKDTGNSISRQMASMYRTLQQVKDDEEAESGVTADDEDTFTDGPDSEPEVDPSAAQRSYDALDTEDDVNKMSDLDSESCSFAGRQNRNRIPKESGLVKSPKQLQVGDNRNVKELDDEKTPQPQEGLHFQYPDNNNESGDPHITPMSLSLTSTGQGHEGGHNDNHEHHGHDHHHHHGRRHTDDHSSDSESDDESLPDTSSDECSRCLCCSSLASYQNIPWRIQRRDSATTTEASDSSEYCSDSDGEEGHRRVPLYAKFSPFFFQEYASGSEGTDECEQMDEDADSLPEQKQERMSPIGRESSPVRDDDSKMDKVVGKVPSTESAGDSEAENVKEKKEEEEEEEIDEQSSVSVIEKIKRMQMKIQDESTGVAKQKPKQSKIQPKDSNLLSPGDGQPISEGAEPEMKKKARVPSPEPKRRHVSKSQMFVVAPPKSNGESKKGKKVMLTAGEEPMFDIPASCIDKEGKVTLRPDPKLAPEAYKSGKMITFQVKHTPDGVIATDGPMVLSTNPATTRTVLRVRSSQPNTPTTPTNTKSSVEVTPDGVINIRKRRTVPVKINPVHAIPVVDTPETGSGHVCNHCNHQPKPEGDAVPRFVTRRVTTHHTTVTPMYGSTPGQSIVINQHEGQQPGQHYVINQQGVPQQPSPHFVINQRGGPPQPSPQFVINQQGLQQHPGQQFTINQGGGYVSQPQPSFVVTPQGGLQQRQIIIGDPQPAQVGPRISVTPSSMTQGSPIVYRTGPGSQQSQSFQISGSGAMQQPPVIRLGGSSPSVRVSGSSQGFTIPVQQAGQSGGMRFVINQ